MKTLKIMLLLVFSGLSTLLHAQNINGSWKKTDEVLTKKNGKTSNTFAMITKAMPCFANIVYTFSGSGKINEQAPDCTATLMKGVGKELANAHWKISGGELTIQTSDASSPVRNAKYQVKFIGNDTMIWTFVYADNPTVPNFTKAQQMQTTYKRQ